MSFPDLLSYPNKYRLSAKVPPAVPLSRQALFDRTLYQRRDHTLDSFSNSALYSVAWGW